MGGHAISNASRISQYDYFTLAGRLFKSNHAIMPMAHVIRSYDSKLDFGDMDILILSSYGHTDPNYKQTYLENAGLTIVETVPNGSVKSFGVLLDDGRIFQIDMISAPAGEYNFTLDYFSFNDAGNLAGRVSRGLGLKLGHNGLWLVQRNENHVLAEHLLTLDYHRALRYLDLDVDHFKRGFDTREDIFEWITKSKYYDWNRFELSQRNHAARIRDKKRPTYTAFLQWAVLRPEMSHELPNKSEFLEQHFRAFDGLREEYQKVQDKEDKRVKASKIYNGDLVRSITSLNGKELGIFMKSLNMTTDKILEHSDDMQSYIIHEFENLSALISKV